MSDLLSQPFALLDSWVPFVGDVLLGRFPLAAFRENTKHSTSLRLDRKYAVVPLVGLIEHRPSVFTEFGFGTSLQRFKTQLELAARSSEVVVLDIDSAGGSTAALEGAADAIYRLRKKKPVVSAANTMMASAAYWLGSQAETVVASPSGYAGSIGTILVHADRSKQHEKAGTSYTVIKASAKKDLASELESLSFEGRRYLKGLVNDAYRMFVSAVARGRGLSADEVKSKRYGEGRVLTAKDALANGLIDGILSFNELVDRLEADGKDAIPKLRQHGAYQVFKMVEERHEAWGRAQKAREAS